MDATKPLRTTLLVASAAWLIAMSLACGGSGDEDESSSDDNAAAAEPSEPAAPADPFAETSATMERLADQLERMATQQPEAFRNPGSITDRTSRLSSSAARSAGTPEHITLRLRWSAGLGGNAQPVYAELTRFPDGRVRIGGLTAQNAAPGASVYVVPSQVTSIGQTVRLRIMDQGCDLPFMDDADLNQAFGHLEFLQRSARAAQGNCAATAAAFNAAPLSLSSASISVRYPTRPGYGVLTSLSAQIASGAQLTYSEPQFGYAR